MGPEPRDVRCPRCGRLLARRHGGGFEVRSHARPPIRFRAGELECRCGSTITVEGPTAPAELRLTAAGGV